MILKESKQRLVLYLVLALVLVWGAVPVFAATVNDFAGLKQAITSGETDITIDGDITVTETLVIDKDVTITGGTLTAGNLIKEDDPNSGNIFYVNDGKTLKLDGVTLDGNSQSRLIYSNGGTIELKDSTLQNGCPGANAKANPGGGVFLRGGSLTATDTKFIGNTPGTTEGLGAGDGDVNGGAIYSGSDSSKISIIGGSFVDNEVKAYGHGAAIYQENGTLTINIDDKGDPLKKDIITSFKNNKGHVEGGNAGTQGACIHTRDQVKATISNVNAEIAKGFNTGGFLRSWKSDVTVTDSTFTIDGLGDGYGYSGGALCFEGGTSKVTGSTFTCAGSKLIHAGGFIDIVGGGTHIIDTNTMTGAGNDNNSAIASFGGAISVEEGARATVTIKGNTITNSTASDNGGAIAIGTHKGVDTPSTVTMSGNIISNSGLIMWKGGAGGAVFVGKGSTVTMSGDEVKDTKAPYGGGVYNEGNLNISGKASLTGGIALSLGGEIYNNGELTVDDATITGSFVGPNSGSGNPHPNKPYELGGTNIYAEKDVTITPNANITTGKDVRVLDGQSKILLTGPLTKEIDVSISEVAGGNEKAKRKVGYVVAEGTNGYSATKADANFLHYIGRTNKKDDSHYSNQPRAAYADDKSTGEWDFVLDKDNKTVVLGQRGELIFDGNGGTFNGEETDKKNYTFYSSEDPYADKSDMKAEKTPTMDGYQFVGWAEDRKDSFESADAYLGADVKKFDDSKSYMSLQEKQTGPITDILNPHTKTVYALWVKQIDIPVKKEWGEGTKDEQKKQVELTLTGGTASASLTLNEANGWNGKFEKVDTISVNGGSDGKDAKITNYSVSEASIPGFTPKTTGDAETGFTVTNTPIKETTDISVTKVWQDENGKDATPTGVTATIKLLGDGVDTNKTLNFTDNGTQKFEKLPKKNDQDKDIVYTISEDTVSGYEKGVVTGNATDGFTVTNKKVAQTPETVDILVTKVWQDENGKGATPTGVTATIKLLADGVDTNKTLNFTDNGTQKFEKLHKKNDQDKDIVYTIAEDTVSGYEKGVVAGNATDGFTVTNKKVAQTPETVDISVTKVWQDENGDEATPTGVTATIKLLADGADTNKTLTFTDNGTQKFEKLHKKNDQGVDIVYKISEETVSGYEAPKITGNAETGFTVTNKKATQIPTPEEKVNIQVMKNWVGAEESDEVPVTITLNANDEATNKTVTLNAENNWTATFEGLAKKDASGNAITYTVTENEVKGFTSKVTGDAAKGFTVTNTKNKPTPPIVTEKIITKYVDENGNNIIPPVEGDKPKKDFTGYEFVTTTEDKVNNSKTITHHYKKIEGRIPPIDFNNIIIFKKSEPVSDDSLLNKYDHKAYMFGYPDWTFRPERNMTRAEATAMFARLLKNYPKTFVKYNLPYSDVFEDDWYYLAVGFMTEKNIITGYEDGTFRPNSPITRAEFATMASKFDSLAKGGGKSFVDVDESHWAYMYINSAFNRGWVTGYEDGTFKPERNISRAEVVTITNKMLDRYCDKEFVINHRDLLIKFTDLEESHWAYFNIMESTHGHDYTRRGNGIDELWHRLNGEEFRFVVVGRK